MRKSQSNYSAADANLPLGIVLTLLVWILMGGLSALVKDASQYAASPVILFSQYIVSFLFVLPFALGKNKSDFIPQNKLAVLIRSLLGVLEFLFFFLAISFIPLMDATLLLNTAPLFVPLLLFLWMQQKFKPILWVPLFIGFIGVACILRPGKELFQIGTSLALLAGIAQAAIMVSLHSAAKEPPFRMIFYYLLFGAGVLFPFLFIYWKPIPSFVYFELFSIGAIFAAVQYLFTKSFQFGSPSHLAPFSYVFVIVSALLDWWIWGIAPSLLTWLGSALIILGGLLVLHLRRRREG